MRMNLEEDFVSIGEPFFKLARKVRDISSMMIFCGMFQQAPDDISWTIDQAEFDDPLALKKDSAPGPDSNSLRCLQMCWWLGFEVPLSCLSSRFGGKEHSSLFC